MFKFFLFFGTLWNKSICCTLSGTERHDIRFMEKELFYQTLIGFIDEKEAACIQD